jgi:putative DNA primase/helicase
MGGADSTPLLDAALSYAARGWRVFPCFEPVDGGCSCPDGATCVQPGKHPRTGAGGLHHATTDEITIREWWAQWPAASVAIATGPESGVDVLDIDPGEGGVDSFVALVQAHGEFPTTAEVRTGSGGTHFYFRSANLRNSQGKVGKGIDIRGDGGYVLAPPSRHASGGSYAWEEKLTPAEVAPVPAPPWLVSLAEQSAPKAPPLTDWRPPDADGISESEAWTRLVGADDADLKGIAGRMQLGEPLFAAGEHEAGLWKAVCFLRFRLPELTDATVLKMLEPSIVAMDCRKHGLDRARSQLAKANAQYDPSWKSRKEKFAEAIARVARQYAPQTESGREGESEDAEAVQVEWMSAPGYAITNGDGELGVFKHAEKGALVTVASAPINVIEEGKDETGTSYVTVRWEHNGKLVEQTVPRVLVAGPGLLELASTGAPVTQANRGGLQTFLQAQEQDAYVQQCLKQVRVFSRSGWSRDFKTFVVGDRPIGEPGRVILEGGSESRGVFMPRGNVDDYMRLTTEVRDQSPLAEMAWAVGYAAPFLRLVELRSIIVSLWGESGGGKSAVQAMAVSPWGRPSDQKNNGDASKAGLEAQMARWSDLPIWIDDTQLMRRGDAAEFLSYVIGSEMSGTRATQTGDGRKRKQWRVMAFISGERPVMEIGGAAGASNRTLEVGGQPLADMELARRTHQELAQNYGHTGPMLIRTLMDEFIKRDRLHELYDAHRDFARQLAADKPEHARHAALLLLADVITRTRVYGEREETARAAAIDVWKEVLANGNEQSSEVGIATDAAYDFIVSWIAANDESFHPGGLKCMGRELPKDGESCTSFAILPHAMQEIAKAGGFNVRQVMSALARKGLLRRDGKNLRPKVTVNGQKVRAWCVRMEK